MYACTQCLPVTSTSYQYVTHRYAMSLRAPTTQQSTTPATATLCYHLCRAETSFECRGFYYDTATSRCVWRSSNYDDARVWVAADPGYSDFSIYQIGEHNHSIPIIPGVRVRVIAKAENAQLFFYCTSVVHLSHASDVFFHSGIWWQVTAAVITSIVIQWRKHTSAVSGIKHSRQLDVRRPVRRLLAGTVRCRPTSPYSQYMWIYNILPDIYMYMYMLLPRRLLEVDRNNVEH